MNKVKRFFSKNTVLIVSAVLALAMVAGAAALLFAPARQAVDPATCEHYKYIATGAHTNEGGDTVYTFRCRDCMTTINETSATSSFIEHKPLLQDGAVVMKSPWEIGAFYPKNNTTVYKPFTLLSGEWCTDGELWVNSTGIRVDDYKAIIFTL